MKFLLIPLMLVLAIALKGQEVRLLSLNDLYERINSGKDTTYVVNFWATWCVPCLQELPHFETLSKQFRQDKMKVLLVSVDFRSKLESTVIPFVRREQLTNEVFLLNETDQQDYINRIDPNWSGALPATLFIHGDKRIFFEQEFSYTELLKAYKNL